MTVRDLLKVFKGYAEVVIQDAADESFLAKFFTTKNGENGEFKICWEEAAVPNFEELIDCEIAEIWNCFDRCLPEADGYLLILVNYEE